MRLLLPNKPPHTDDTYARDKLGEIMNTITKKYYGFILVMCPDCGVITPRHDDEEHICTNPSCDIEFRASDAPDLFF